MDDGRSSLVADVTDRQPRRVGTGFHFLAATVLGAVFACSGDSTSPGPDPSVQITHVSQIDPWSRSGVVLRCMGTTPDAVTGAGNTALIGGLNTGRLYVVDASDPATPVAVGMVQVPSFDMKTWRQFAYTVTGRGDIGASNEGRIVDLSDPAAPTIVGSFPSSHNVTIDGAGVHVSRGARSENL